MYWNVGDRVKLDYPAEPDWQVKHRGEILARRTMTWHGQHGTIQAITRTADGNCYVVETDAGNIASFFAPHLRVPDPPTIEELPV